MRIISSLKSKIIIVVSLILAVTIGLGTWINIGYQRAQIRHSLEDNSLIISNTIERSLANAMLSGKSKEVQSILEAVSQHSGSEDIQPPRGHSEIVPSLDDGKKSGPYGREMVPQPGVQKTDQARR